jgi:hypothetical protein
MGGKGTIRDLDDADDDAEELCVKRRINTRATKHESDKV